MRHRRGTHLAGLEPLGDKFVTGQEPLSKFDEFVERLNKLGAAEVTSVRQQQYERYGRLTGN